MLSNPAKQNSRFKVTRYQVSSARSARHLRSLPVPPTPSLTAPWQSPKEEASATFTPPERNVSMGASGLTTSAWERGLQYELALPWTELAPAQPTAGMQMGLYLILFNNDGGGLLDTLHWPRPLAGMWLIPRRWGQLTLV